MLHHQIFQQIKHHLNMHFAIYLVDKNYHKICTCYDFMQEKTIIFLSTKSLFWQITKVGFGEEKNFAGPSTFPRHEGPHCQGGQRGGVYTKQVTEYHSFSTKDPQSSIFAKHVHDIFSTSWISAGCERTTCWSTLSSRRRARPTWATGTRRSGCAIISFPLQGEETPCWQVGLQEDSGEDFSLVI